MASNDERFQNDRLRGLDELDDYDVAEGEPDPRGWDVCVGSKKIGQVDDLIVDTGSMRVKYLDVDLDNDALKAIKNRQAGDHVSVPVERAQLNDDRKQVILSGERLDDLFASNQYRFSRRAPERARAGSSHRTREYDVQGRGEEGPRTLTRSEEELRTGKERFQSGEVVIGKHVETEHVTQPASRVHEEVNIERHPVSERPAAEAEIGSANEEVRVPIMEERVTAEKRPVVKEELVVNKRAVEDKDSVEADLRKEQFDIRERGSAKDRNRK